VAAHGGDAGLLGDLHEIMDYLVVASAELIEVVSGSDLTDRQPLDLVPRQRFPLARQPVCCADVTNKGATNHRSLPPGYPFGFIVADSLA